MPLSFGTREGRSRGQSLAEFAVVLPVLAALVGAAVDLSRMYEQRVKLEAATRDAAEYVASDKTVTTIDQARTRAKAVVCTQFGLAATCTSPSVTVTAYSRSTTDPGTAEFPQVSVTVSSSLGFSTLFPWPFISSNWKQPYANGGDTSGGPAKPVAASLTATKTFTLLQGR